MGPPEAAIIAGQDSPFGAVFNGASGACTAQEIASEGASREGQGNARPQHFLLRTIGGTLNRFVSIAAGHGGTKLGSIGFIGQPK
jgi:hypothetical protein